MTTLSRRAFVELAAATAAIGASANVLAQTTKPAAITSLTKSAKPITSQERIARLANVQSLMQQRKVGALLIEEPGIHVPGEFGRLEDCWYMTKGWGEAV